MNRFFIISARILPALFLLLLLNTNSNGEGKYNSSTLIVKFKAGTSLFTEARELVPKTPEGALYIGSNVLYNGGIKTFLSEYDLYWLKGAKPDADTRPLPAGMERIFIAGLMPGAIVENVRDRLIKSGEFDYVEFDHIGFAGGMLVPGSEENTAVLPNDPLFSSQWGLRNTGQSVNGISGTSGGDINIVNAWDITTGNTSIKVAVLDSGIPLTHPEFSGRLLQGYDYANNDNDPTDDQGHGTNVASIIGANGNNNSLIAGINWSCKIIPVKILNSSNSGLYSWWVSGITYAVDNGAKVLNMSVGGSSPNAALEDAVNYAYNNGRIIVACMMNNNNNATYYPAGYPNLISIGAINNRMQRAVPFCWGGGSSYGPHIDFAAPGEMIIGLSNTNPSATSYWCGTSQATPMVCGVVSLLFSVNSSLTYTQIYNALKNSARDQVGPSNEDTPGFDNYFGWGLINSRGALDQLNAIQPISAVVPEKFGLHQNYPNPFNPVTKIRFDIPAGNSFSTVTKLTVFNSLGQEIAVPVNELLSPGTYEAEFDGSKSASGVYYYRLESGSYSDMKKMILIK